MSHGIRATVTFSQPGACPIARHSETIEGPIDQVSRSVTLPGSTASVTEYLGDPGEEDERESVFSYGDAELYRISHDGEPRCPCETLGEFGCPVHRYVAEDGELTVTFHVEDFERLQDVMATLRERCIDVSVERLLQPPLEGPPGERVFINRGKLTDRQLEVLELAYDRGYFERPKGANATELAAELGVSRSTLAEHLVTAQRKILEDILRKGGLVR
ncbi:helix-turn-helix domain-containing protein [Natrialbaceae archaeon A-gly3]